MHTSTLLTLASAALLSTAHPLLDKQNHNRQRRDPPYPPYSVVNVDGSNGDNGSPVTVYETVSAEQTKTVYLTSQQTQTAYLTKVLPGTTKIQTTTMTMEKEHKAPATTVTITFTKAGEATPATISKQSPYLVSNKIISTSTKTKSAFASPSNLSSEKILSTSTRKESAHTVSTTPSVNGRPASRSHDGQRHGFSTSKDFKSFGPYPIPSTWSSTFMVASATAPSAADANWSIFASEMSVATAARKSSGVPSRASSHSAVSVTPAFGGAWGSNSEFPTALAQQTSQKLALSPLSTMPSSVGTVSLTSARLAHSSATSAASSTSSATIPFAPSKSNDMFSNLPSMPLTHTVSPTNLLPTDLLPLASTSSSVTTSAVSPALVSTPGVSAPTNQLATSLLRSSSTTLTTKLSTSLSVTLPTEFPTTLLRVTKTTAISKLPTTTAAAQ